MEEEVTVEELKAAIRKGTIACKIHPVFVGSSYNCLLYTSRRTVL